jgi:hypothetical protein
MSDAEEILKAVARLQRLMLHMAPAFSQAATGAFT